jgi:hypothetical protein
MNKPTHSHTVVKTAYLRLHVRSDAEAAARIGVSAQTFGNWMRKSITVAQLAEMADVLYMTDEDIVSFVRGYKQK